MESGASGEKSADGSQSKLPKSEADAPATATSAAPAESTTAGGASNPKKTHPAHNMESGASGEKEEGASADGSQSKLPKPEAAADAPATATSAAPAESTTAGGASNPLFGQSPHDVESADCDHANEHPGGEDTNSTKDANKNKKMIVDSACHPPNIPCCLRSHVGFDGFLKKCIHSHQQRPLTIPLNTVRRVRHHTAV